jgi:hypothetical protein
MKIFRSVAKPIPVLLAGGAIIVATVSITPIAGATAPGDSSSAPGTSQLGVPVSPDGKYIVELSAAPLALYDGGLPGLAATQSADGVTMRRTGAAVDAYLGYLDAQRASVLRAVPGVQPFYEYDWAYAGFAASLTEDQARTLAGTPGVRALYANDMLRIDTTHTPAFLGISEAGGLWEQAGGPEEAGECNRRRVHAGVGQLRATRRTGPSP